MRKDLGELIEFSTESHNRFIEAIVAAKDEALAVLAYANYVRALAIVLERLLHFA